MQIAAHDSTVHTHWHQLLKIQKCKQACKVQNMYSVCTAIFTVAIHTIYNQCHFECNLVIYFEGSVDYSCVLLNFDHCIALSCQIIHIGDAYSPQYY